MQISTVMDDEEQYRVPLWMHRPIRDIVHQLVIRNYEALVAYGRSGKLRAANSGMQSRITDERRWNYPTTHLTGNTQRHISGQATANGAATFHYGQRRKAKVILRFSSS